MKLPKINLPKLKYLKWAGYVLAYLLAFVLFAFLAAVTALFHSLTARADTIEALRVIECGMEDEGRPAVVTGVALSPDGQAIVAACDDHLVRPMHAVIKFNAALSPLRPPRRHGLSPVMVSPWHVSKGRRLQTIAHLLLPRNRHDEKAKVTQVASTRRGESPKHSRLESSGGWTRWALTSSDPSDKRPSPLPQAFPFPSSPASFQKTTAASPETRSVGSPGLLLASMTVS